MSGILSDTVSYLTTGSNWSGTADVDGLGLLIGQHLEYTVIAVAVAAVVAVPLGLLVGHTGKGEVVVVGLVNVLRSLPTLGLLLLFILWMGLGLTPTMFALILLGIPPMLAGAYSGVANVDRVVVDASRAMGHSELQILLRVELPNALPLILGGLRNATLQIVATAAIAAYAGLGGLGRPIFDGLATYDYPPMIAGSLLVTILALVLDSLLAGLVWLSMPGTGRLRPAPTLVRG
ncbi:ABC transporter permease [Williamsia phyllosphaerae]|uniref:Osmoprotectant (Glycine betaine/ carnitine/choline/l-proline) ABC transporter ProZ n=1 Tax=Williamsia phyllosphaerae TaxID=885042 RepID=A0ABQ1UJA0_9NOCA|nr:ABC transporter permease subunit [Williamsia phyllosphaerae]GGF19236.1 putative osmoprotectant (glycine betaine/ carnitine/choline/l-proline) ABC transporter ProZ [Williamsia phyllosphaerae]